MAESPAFQFYPSDFTGSSTVGTADASEICAYTMLLCLDWMEGGFEFNEVRLARWCRLSRTAFRRAWTHLASKFPPRDGRHFNQRLEKERVKQAEHRRRQADRGRAGAEKRWHGDSGGHSGGHSASSPEAMAQAIRENSSLISHLSTTNDNNNNNNLPSVRKKREPRPVKSDTPRETWLTPAEQAWETVNGVGSFDLGQAARELSKIYRSAEHPDPRRLTADQIAGRITWYLRVRGLDHPDPTQEMIERTRFTPNLRDFRLRHAKFAAGDPPTPPIPGGAIRVGAPRTTSGDPTTPHGGGWAPEASSAKIA